MVEDSVATREPRLTEASARLAVNSIRRLTETRQEVPAHKACACQLFRLRSEGSSIKQAFFRSAMIRRVSLRRLCLAVRPRHSPCAKQLRRGARIRARSSAPPGRRARMFTSLDWNGRAARSVTNATGLYEIAGLQPGSYELSVESSGFQQATQRLNLEVGQQATVDMRPARRLRHADRHGRAAVERTAQDAGRQRRRSCRPALGRFPAPQRPHAH